tara:strand:- start:212 stop:583 length:372 start_codon:yes stop_codon:yes gene_type:complete
MKKDEENIMKQLELFTNSWGLNSGFENLANQLTELLPMQGRCESPMSKNKHLEKFRRAQNAAYDLFNNGLGNKRGLFVSVFGDAPTQKSVNTFTKVSWEQWEDRVEEMLTPMIIAAAKEQGIK